MGTIKLTSYGSSLREPVKIDGFVLTSVYYSVDEIYLLDVISDLTYSDLYFVKVMFIQTAVVELELKTIQNLSTLHTLCCFTLTMKVRKR